MLTEKKKADRAKMAAMVQALCEEMGASCELRDAATHVWPDGSRASPDDRRRLNLEIAIGAARIGIEFDGGSYNSQPDVHCMPWNIDHESEELFSPAFGRAVGDTVNPHHHRKCMGFANGIDALLMRLRAAMECVNRGDAFLVKGAPIPFSGPSHEPAALVAAGFQPIGKPAVSSSAAGFQRVAYEMNIPQSQLTAFRHPDGYWQMYRRPEERAA